MHLGADSSELDAAAQKSIEDMIELANTAMAAGQMTEGQMREMFGSMGYSPEVTYREEQVENKNSGYFKMGLLTLPYENVSYNTVKVPQIADKNSDGNVSLTKITTAKSLGGSTKKPKDSGGKVKEAERYHEIKKVIEDLEKDLDALGKAKDRAFGKDKIALMNQEIAKLQDMKAAQEQYLTEIEKFYDQDKKAIAKFGAEFDDEGRIINYDELMAKYGSNEEAMKALEQYEETYDLLKDKQEEIKDLQRQEYDKALEITQYKVDLKIDVNSDDLKFLEYLLGNLTDSAYDAADAIANLGQQTAAQLGNQEAYIQGINNIFKEHGLGEDSVSKFLNGSLSAEDLENMEFTESEIDSLRNYKDGLLETNKALEKIRDDV